MATTAEQGARLGMWQAPPGVDPTTAFTLDRVFPAINPEDQFNRDKRLLEFMDELQTKQAEKRQKLGEESTQKALLYQTLANLPGTIAAGFGNQMSLQAQGAANISNMMMEGARNMATIPGYQPVGMNYAIPRYFGT